MGSRLNQLLYLLKGYFGLFLSIGFGIFLFVLFFQPFPLEKLEFNDRLIFVAGLGSIVFLFMVLIRIFFPLLLQHNNYYNDNPALFGFLKGFILFVLSSVAFAFFLRYVGGVRISFYLMLKVAIICLAAPVVIRIYDMVDSLKRNNVTLMHDKKALLKQVEKFEEDYLNKTLAFFSENGAETLSLLIADIAFIRSADNYVEIVYLEAGVFKKKLIRNTMKNVEQQIKSYSNFVRCHRICIVNTHFIEKLNKIQDNHWIILKGYDDKIPVSRQYLLRLKEIL